MTKQTPPKKQESFIKTLVQIFLIVWVIRSFVFAPFHIPSGSMYPTIEIGDRVIVSKYPFGTGPYSFWPVPKAPYEGRLFAFGRDPKYGDVVVFRDHEANSKIDLIKRVVGLPGDRIQMKNGQLYLNDKPVKRKLITTEERTVSALPSRDKKRKQENKQVMDIYEETLPNGTSYQVYFKQGLNAPRARNFGPYTVPEDSFFCMGDNRDYSKDCRVKGLKGKPKAVPYENLLGRGEFVLFSHNSFKSSFWQAWTWFKSIRGSRTFKTLHPQKTQPAQSS